MKNTLTSGFISLTLFTNSYPSILGILISEITNPYFVKFCWKCSNANNGSVKPDIWNPCFWSSRWNHPSSNSIILLDLIINVVELYIFLLYYGYYYPFSDILSQFIRWLLYYFQIINYLSSRLCPTYPSFFFFIS